MISGILAESTSELNIRFSDLISALSALRSLSAINLKVESEELLIRNALQALMQNQDMERCSVFLLRGRQLINSTGLDWEDLDSGAPSPSDPRSASARFRIGEGLVGHAALSRTLQHCRNCKNDPRFKSKRIKRVFRKSPTPGSIISAPIEFDNELLGVLNISHPRTDFFNEWHERLLLTYCALIGHLIKNWRTLQEMGHQLKHRTADLEKALNEANLLKKRFESLSLRDELTGIFNRRYFFPQAEIALANAVRYRQSLAVLLMDLDHFKGINDQCGHQSGDEVLQSVAAILNGQVREGDIVARYGGEEFVAVLPNTPFTNALAFAERIRETVNNMDLSSLKTQLRVSTSIGISFLDPAVKLKKSVKITQLIKSADIALYKAKQQGRNRVIAVHVSADGTPFENT